MDGVICASKILKEAIEFDNSLQYANSICSYQEGISVLVKATAYISDSRLKEDLRQKIEEYIVRANAIKKHVAMVQSKQPFHKQIVIIENSTGFSYETIFSKYLDNSVYTIEIDDPHIKVPHQCDNFMHFVEICMKHATNLKAIKLTTGRDEDKGDHFAQQRGRLETIVRSAQQATNCQISYKFSNELHDREVRFDNGFVIKIGRGLDLYHKTDRYMVGWIDYSFRKCRQTSIDIFYNHKMHRCQ